ncbi:MAG: hypothetical protein NTY24_08130 [Mycobacterium sp.]|nr:hypothetical protein [Mycobacterium sp.]
MLLLSIPVESTTPVLVWSTPVVLASVLASVPLAVLSVSAVVLVPGPAVVLADSELPLVVLVVGSLVGSTVGLVGVPVEPVDPSVAEPEPVSPVPLSPQPAMSPAHMKKESEARVMPSALAERADKRQRVTRELATAEGAPSREEWPQIRSGAGCTHPADR